MAKRTRKLCNHFVAREVGDDDKDCPFTYGSSERILSRHNKCGFSTVRSQHLEDVVFEDCKLVGCSLVTFGSAENRSTARRIQLKRCSVNSFYAAGAIFEDVVVEGLKVSAHPIALNGCAFHRCIIGGVCGRFLLWPERGSSPEEQYRNAAFAAANAEYYRNVDWAIDISKAKLSCFENRGAIPPHLILRNPDEQFLMTRDVALGGRWQKHKPHGAVTIGINAFIAAGGETEFFVCGSRSTSFKEQVEYFQRLKSKGLVT